MGLNHGAKISTNGLVLCLDAANVKSFRGEPTINYYANFGPWCTVGGTNTDVTGTNEQGPITTSKTWKFEKSGTSNQWNGWEGAYGVHTGSAGDIWTTSYWYKTSASAGITEFGVGEYFVNDWSRAYNATILANNNEIVADGKWHYNYTTTQINEAYNNAIIVDGPSWGYNTIAGVLYINGLQWERKSYPTPFVYGTRGTTVATGGGWKDISNTGNNGELGNILYDGSNGGSLSFNGSSYITITSMTQLNNNYTLSAWVNIPEYVADTNLGQVIIQQYGGNIGWIFSLCGPNAYLQIRNHYNGVSVSYNLQYSTTLSLNEWYYVNATDNGTIVKLYVNGVSVTSMASSISTPGTDAYVGSWFTSGSNRGKIGVVQCFNKALSDTEILQNFNALKGRYLPLGSKNNPANSALDIKTSNPAATDGIYWINLPIVGATQTYCIMNSAYDGGGWMLMMKATSGPTFQYDANYWTTNNTLNPTDLTLNDADAKYNVMNYYSAKDMMARFPDITQGGSIAGVGAWTWLENNFYNQTRIVPITLFSTVNRYFIKDAKTFSGWSSGVFSSQTDIRFYGFNWTDNKSARWGFGWNENGGGLYPNGVEGSDDVGGGIGLKGSVTYSAGDYIGCCNDTTGINRSARVEVYVR